MQNFKKVSVSGTDRVELHDKLGLTGAEISVNVLPAGAKVPFVHAHKKNEEIYVILQGEGVMTIDGTEVPLRENDYLSILPGAKRQLAASGSDPLKYLCIQVREHSLEGYTATDAEIF